MNANQAVGYLYLTDAHYLSPLLARPRLGNVYDSQFDNPPAGQSADQPDGQPTEVPADTSQPQPARARKPKTLRVGKFVIGDDSCHGLGGHPDIRY